MDGAEKTLPERLDLMLAQRWNIPFRIRVNDKNTVVMPTWVDGPTIATVKALRDELQVYPGENEELKWGFMRYVSPTAWALLRGPQHAPSSDIPWSQEQIQEHLDDDSYDRLDLGEVHRLEFNNVDLTDLTTLATPEVLAQAEVAATLGMDGRRRFLWEEGFDLWLRTGGWTMSGRLLTHPPSGTLLVS